MGRVITPKYALQLDPGAAHIRSEAMVWDNQRYGKPSPENLERYVMKYAKSLESGGSNYHLSKWLGFVPYPRWARIIENKADGKVLVEWKAARFQVYG